MICEEEQLKMNDCYSDHKDWRVCKKQVANALGGPEAKMKVLTRALVADGGISRMLEETRKRDKD